MSNSKTTHIYTLYYSNKKIVKLHSPITAFAWYQNYRIDLITGKKEVTDFQVLKQYLNNIKINQQHKNRVIHLTYELGYLFIDESSLIKNDSLLCVDVLYNEKGYYQSNNRKKIDLKLKLAPSFLDYEEAFIKGRQKLLDGDCYQFNLTFPYIYNFNNKTPEAFISKMFSNTNFLGAYAHATWIPYLNKMILSNSPECLFQLRENSKGFKCWTMPIKGSLSYTHKDIFQDKWNELTSSVKDQAELFMIADLMRNDLSKIENSLAKIIKKKLPLKVPNILHQFSLISVQLTKQLSLGLILQSIFPGGSITGAPKKRVMKILNNLEKWERSFYTGSTIILDEEVLASSINIRTAVIDFDQQILKYGAGGGITLLSNKEDEFKEMELKVKSFIDILTS